MSIARDISRQTRRSIVEVTSGNAGTNFTVSGGFSGSSLDVYLNGAKLIINSDYSLNGTSGIILNQAAVAGDIIEFVSRNTSSVINVVDTSAIIDEAVTFDKLSDSATESSNVQKRVAKAWVNFNGTGTVAIRAAYNVSSIADQGVGIYELNFTESMPDTNYAAVGSSGTDVAGGLLEVSSINKSATVQRVYSKNSTNNTNSDQSVISVAIFR
jgi:uncharacterized protein YkvS